MTPDFPVHLFEEHSSTLSVWWDARANPRTAVYLDAHLDLQQSSDAQIQALASCENLAQVKALEAPHHLNHSSRYAFGIENFLYAATRLKLIDRLIWVVPPHIPRGYSAALLEYIQQMDGVNFDELTGFQSVGRNALRGSLLGLDITICDYSQLNSLNISKHYYLDIDIDYFVDVPRDHIWIDPDTVIRSILDQLGKPALATISRAVGSGFTPLPMRFLADYAAAIVADNKADSAHFQKLLFALRQIEQSNPQAAVSICQLAINLRPECAASHFIMSIAMGLSGHSAGDIENERRYAIELDPNYAFDLARAACGFPNRHRKPSLEQIEALSSQLGKGKSPRSDLNEIALGQLYAAAGQLRQAWQHLQTQSGELKNHCELLLAIAHGILDSSEPHKAKTLLELAANSHRTRSNANLLLGDLAYRAGDISTALHHYQKVSQYAPAWMLPLQRQAQCHEALGEHIPLAQISELIQQRQQRIENLLHSAP